MAAVTGSAGSSNPLVPDQKYGVWGESDTGYGVVGTSSQSSGVQGGSISGSGTVGTSTNSNGVVGISANLNGVYGRSDLAGQFDPEGTTVGGTGVFGENNLPLGYGVKGQANGEQGIGVHAEGNATGVEAIGGSTGVSGECAGGTGVFGRSESGIGVHGFSFNNVRIGDRPGIRGDGDAEDGVWGISQNGNGVYAYTASKEATAYAAWLDGRVYIRGPLFKPGGTFQIDHPLDPANKYLNHSFVESPDMKNIYDGIVVLDAKGEAEVKLPGWFHALNGEFRYQLTPIGASGPSLHIAQKIANNRFKIAGGAPRMKVSWQVTGVRVDAWAKAHQIRVEQDKPAEERGRYLHPELYKQPEEKAVDWALRSAARVWPRTAQGLGKRSKR